MLGKWKKISSLSLGARVTLANVILTTILLVVGGFTVYQYACRLVGSLAGVETAQQQFFNETLLEYVLLIFLILLISGGFFYSYVTRKIMEPIRQLAASTEELSQGKFPQRIEVKANDELRTLAQNFNRLSLQLKETEDARAKMVSDMAHEFRTPLSNINGYLEGLKKGVIPPDRSLFDNLYQESSHLTNMVNNLYQLSEWKMQAGTPALHKKSVNMDEMIHSTVALFHWELDNNEIPLQLETDSQIVHADPDSIKQMISNLLQNAIQHRLNNAPIYIHGYKQGQNYIVEVQNNGVWINPSTSSRVFDRFYREDDSRDRSTGGSGIGLAIVKEMAEQHEGDAGLHTNGYFHHFWFFLPIYTPEESFD